MCMVLKVFVCEMKMEEKTQSYVHEKKPIFEIEKKTLVEQIFILTHIFWVKLGPNELYINIG